MPLVNIYFKESGEIDRLRVLMPDLKKYLAEKLTCGEIALSPTEVSIRLMKVADGDMIADVEVEIAAHSFSERVARQDEICREIMIYIQEKTGMSNIKVWLQLSELGHSW